MQHRSSRRLARSARLVAVVALLGGALAGLAASHQTFAAGLSLTPTATSTSTPAAATGGRTFYAWGDNTYGQLGDGTATDRHTPGPVTLPSGVHATAIAAGYYHSLALGSDGRLYACGRDYQGELGNGAFIKRSTPVAVTLPGGARVTAIAAGGGHSLALVAPLTDTATSTPVPPTVTTTSTPVPPTATTTSTPVPPTATAHPMPRPGPPFTLSIAVARDSLTRGSVVAVGLRGGTHWRVDLSLTLSVRRVAAVTSPRRPAGHGRHPATTLQLVVLYRQAAHLLLDARGQGRAACSLAAAPRAPLTATLTVSAHVASRSVTVSRVVRLVPPPPRL